MSVVQHIRDRAGHFRWMGLLVVWAVFIAMAAVLLIERAGVQYSAGQHKLGMPTTRCRQARRCLAKSPRAWLLPTRTKMASRTSKSSSTKSCLT